MVTEPLPDWMQKALLVGTYDDAPILVQIDGSGLFSGGLGAYKDRYIGSNYRESTGTDLNCDTSPVDVGEIWIVTNIAVWHDDPIPRMVSVYLRQVTLTHTLFRNQFLLQYEIEDRQGLWVLKEGDYMRAVFVTPANGQHGSLTITGYKTEDLT